MFPDATKRAAALFFRLVYALREYAELSEQKKQLHSSGKAELGIKRGRAKTGATAGRR